MYSDNKVLQRKRKEGRGTVSVRMRCCIDNDWKVSLRRLYFRRDLENVTEIGW